MSFFSKIFLPFQILFPGKPDISTDDIPDLTGKVVIVTGANTGEKDSSLREPLIISLSVLGIGKEKAKACTASFKPQLPLTLVGCRRS